MNIEHGTGHTRLVQNLTGLAAQELGLIALGTFLGMRVYYMEALGEGLMEAEMADPSAKIEPKFLVKEVLSMLGKNHKFVIKTNPGQQNGCIEDCRIKGGCARRSSHQIECKHQVGAAHGLKGQGSNRGNHHRDADRGVHSKVG